MIWRAVRAVVIVAALPAALAACSEADLALHLAKQAGRDEPQSPSGGAYKVGKPYQVAGVWYYPREDPTYDRTGIASWYGDAFHGKRTANGEIYDMNALTAAHKTLPMPSKVRVTNLENGRSLVLRVNDRGPFAPGRIIDVTRRAAQLLGFYNKGTAKVRVTAVSEGPATLVAEKPKTPAAQRTALPALPRGEISTGSLAPPPGLDEAKAEPSGEARIASSGDAPLPSATPEAAPQVERLPVKASTSIFVQAGAFASAENANRLRARLAYIGPSRVSNVVRRGQELFRVRIGPLATVAQADQALQQVIAAGIPDAQIIVD